VASRSSEPTSLTPRLAALVHWLLLAGIALVGIGLVTEGITGVHDWFHVIGVGLLVATPFLVTAAVGIAAFRSHPRLAAFAAATLVLVALGAWVA
jgi:hypothetical protein